MALSALCCLWYGCHLGVALLGPLGGLRVSGHLIAAETFPGRPSPGRDPGDGPLRRGADDLRAPRGLLLTQLLSTLNLTEQGPPSAAPAETADYMLELYERVAFSSPPAASIVRSFRNQDSSPYRVTAGGTRIHPLLFHVSVPHRENIRLAQLRLYAAARPSAPGAQATVDRKVTVYQVREGAPPTTGAGPGERRRGDRGETETETEQLATQRIRAEGQSWMSFDLTHAVKTWRSPGRATHRLEVHVAKGPRSEEGKGEEEEEGEGGASVDIAIERDAEGQHNAVILLFSDEPGSDRKQAGTEPGRRAPERQAPLPDHPDRHAVWEAGKGNDDHHAHSDKQSPHQQQYQQQQHHQQQQHQQQQHHHQQHQQQQQQPAPRSRTRRSAKSEPCKRSPLYVDFKDIGWDQWVIQPLGYEAYECNGVCSMPMTAEVSPTKHAIVQTLLSHKRPQKASRACCVPTKLDSIALLYHDNGVVTFNHKYEGMVVAECGCR